MNKNKRQSVAEKKQRLIKQIEQQRHQLSMASKEWLEVTEPYDRSWQIFVSFRPIFIAAAGLISIYTLKQPKRIFSLGKKALTTWGLVRSIQNAVNTSKK
ncbi:YqjK-like family protein [Providencia sp. PROV149]|uniref:YqjK-like family protein n=1 Tax=Providencia sp. PROV149 TaxID=2949859 RepID=UPI0023493966|nr:YqjK-like family protein [Providencia sp. PROV149]